MVQMMSQTIILKHKVSCIKYQSLTFTNTCNGMFVYRPYTVHTAVLIFVHLCMVYTLYCILLTISGYLEALCSIFQVGC